MKTAFTILLLLALALVILVCIPVAHAGDYNPAWDDREWIRTEKERDDDDD